MKHITMVDLRRDAEKILQQVQQGQRMVLTYRGKPVARLEPIASEEPGGEDPFYEIYRLATSAGKNLTNLEIDDVLYGP
ncbi:MAG: type II toxin-antitoxin system prevent-host-death family antitoxin [Armatimonadetes bacterium]|nr:type II toxin-antitoxin system prevent-host-death family antitoxin [Armatimonadota bacterium]